MRGGHKGSAWGKWPYRLRRWTEVPATRMEGKLFIVFLFLVLLPIGLITFIASERYTGTIENNTVAYVSQISDKMMSKLDDYTTDMKKISIIPSYLNEIQTGLQWSNEYYKGKDKESFQSPSAGESQMKLQITRKVESSIAFMNNIKEGTSNVYLFDLYGNPYYVIKSGGKRSNLQQFYDSWKESAYEAAGKPVLVSTQEIAGQPGSKQQYMFTVVRDIIDKSYRSIGMIAVDANINVIEGIVNDLDQTTHGLTMILDQKGYVIYDSEKKYLAQNLSQNEVARLAVGSSGSFHLNVNGEPQLVVYKRSEETGWLMLITVPENRLMEQAVQTRNYTFAAAAAVMAFALFISLVLIFALTRPLRSMVKLMKNVQSGNLDVTFPLKRRDEAGMVGLAFNRMMARIKQLIEDIYTIEQRKKQTELDSLQHQINPHFIYNTLETIRMTAVLHDDAEIGDMVQQLGQQLRYSIHNGHEIVPAEREWEHLRSYMQLVNYRYGDMFQLELPEEAAVAGIRVMKLLFQPIVENCVNHGYTDAKARFHIRVSYRREGTDHCFTVKDDGAGMSERELMQLRSSLELEKPARSDGHGIGLRNIHERLRLRYGAMYGLTVNSKPGEGTEVAVRIPVQEPPPTAV
ncbi:cache domain-containing sensor histidine kinase [Paenibacillus protaetiae]|uniref:histidine kinase n=1 Tax=Paenibacillus protaetiae TaxID=2509456 RepID=A0A4P6EZ07_9BACL|nr:sensor histidine kinase [Paenibacillus protaetiae]QAY67995.1 sensor histidine kinase [Paenibacillus protaetiae]